MKTFDDCVIVNEKGIVEVHSPYIIQDADAARYLQRWLVVKKWGCMYICFDGQGWYVLASLVYDIKKDAIVSGIPIPPVSREWTLTEVAEVINRFWLLEQCGEGYVIHPWYRNEPAFVQFLAQAGVCFTTTEEGYDTIVVNGRKYPNVTLVVCDGVVFEKTSMQVISPLSDVRTLSTGEIIGYKVLRQYGDRSNLVSPVVSTKWYGAKLHCPDKVEKDGNMGIHVYAFPASTVIDGHIYFTSPYFPGHRTVLAIVAASGKIVIHDAGFRASDARVIAGITLHGGASDEECWNAVRRLSEMDISMYNVELPDDVHTAVSLQNITGSCQGWICDSNGDVQFVEWGDKYGMPYTWGSELLFWWEVSADEAGDWLCKRITKAFIISNGATQYLVGVDDETIS